MKWQFTESNLRSFADISYDRMPVPALVPSIEASSRATRASPLFRGNAFSPGRGVVKEPRRLRPRHSEMIAKVDTKSLINGRSKSPSVDFQGEMVDPDSSLLSPPLSPGYEPYDSMEVLSEVAPPARRRGSGSDRECDIAPCKSRSTNKKLSVARGRPSGTMNTVRRCISCGARSSPCWRPSWDAQAGRLCNSCGLRYRKSGNMHCSDSSCAAVPSKQELVVAMSKAVATSSRKLECPQCSGKLITG